MEEFFAIFILAYVLVYGIFAFIKVAIEKDNNVINLNVIGISGLAFFLAAIVQIASDNL